MSDQGAVPKTMTQRLLDPIERAGNLVPHPVVIFLILIGLVMVSSIVLSYLGASATLEQIDPEINEIVTSTACVSCMNHGSPTSWPSRPWGF